MRWLAGLVLGTALAGVEVPLAAPLSTIVKATMPAPPGGVVVSARVTVPPDAPDDLGIGAWAGDRHGLWVDRPQGRLSPGKHRIRIVIGSGGPVRSAIGWGPWQAGRLDQGGLFLWSTRASRAVVSIDQLRLDPAPGPEDQDQGLLDLDWPRTATTGERWQATFRLRQPPANPFDPDEAAVDLVVTAPDGTVTRHPAFWDLPLDPPPPGVEQQPEPAGPGRFAVRWRPRQPGSHHLRLEVRGARGEAAADLGTVVATSGPWDGYLRVDRQDPRFFSVDGAFVWPRAVNLRSLNDSRAVQHLGTQPVPDLGHRTWEMYLDRFAAGGIDTMEVWLASWSLALEWNASWPGFDGTGRYHLANAWRLDRLLDHAEAQGQRILLVINNHGQGSLSTDREWVHHPYAQENGGPLAMPELLFTSTIAAQLQSRHRRYLAGRYADSPALAGWKLWSEVDLTTAGQADRWDDIRRWHAAAAADLARLDPVGHPVTTHFCSTWRNVRRQVAELPGMGFLTIDAYHSPLAEPGGALLADLLGIGASTRGLARYRKPLWVTECGGNWNAGPEPVIAADHASGPWAALVSGYAASPMLWWFSWVDQGGRFGPYQAIRAYLEGEDLRGSEASSAVLRGEPGDLWIRAWVRPGRLLGYLQHRTWGGEGRRQEVAGAQVRIGEAVAPGGVEVVWWDADTGVPQAPVRLRHPGGPLVIDAPPFVNHLAFKLIRTP